MKKHGFFAMISRMRYIFRWSLMRTSVPESLTCHSYDVAVLAHALAAIGQKIYKKDVNPEHIACMAMFHDCSEIITGDMPTPVKYSSEQMTKLFHDAEDNACETLLKQLPDELKPSYRALLLPEEDTLSRCYIKAADKLSALIKCQEELIGANNTDFASAYHTCLGCVLEMAENCEELSYFLENFYPCYGQTLDELQRL